MKETFAWILFVFLMPAGGFAMDCESQREAYQQASKSVVFQGIGDQRRITPALVAQTRPMLERLMNDAIRTSLEKEPALSPEQIRMEIECVQGRARAEEEHPNLPYVIPISDSVHRRFLTAYVINAGGDGIPDSIPSVALWSLTPAGWQARNVDMSLYERSSFSITPIATDSRTQANLLLIGKEYGDNVSRLKLMILHIDSYGVKESWKEFGYEAGTVSVRGHKIVVRYIPDAKTEMVQEVDYIVASNGIPKPLHRAIR